MNIASCDTLPPSKIFREYQKLNQIEKVLRNELQKLLEEEEQLRKALNLSKESGKERMIRERKEKEEDALQRLEVALMEVDDDDDENSSTDSGNKSNNFLNVTIEDSCTDENL